jgi:DNA repair protein RadC
VNGRALAAGIAADPEPVASAIPLTCLEACVLARHRGRCTMAAVKKWGQVIEDHGYMTGECSHAYRSVMFEARAEFVEDLDEKRRALSLMIDHADPDPEPLKQKLVATADLKQVLVIRLVVVRMSGKHRQ